MYSAKSYGSDRMHYIVNSAGSNNHEKMQCYTQCFIKKRDSTFVIITLEKLV